MRRSSMGFNVDPAVVGDHKGDALLRHLEATGKIPSSKLFRRMVCNTYLSTGGCPFSDRCVFLHDPRLRIPGINLRAIKGGKGAKSLPPARETKDAFYWPDLTKDAHRELDALALPRANVEYTIPPSFAKKVGGRGRAATSLRWNHHNRAVYSLWHHLIDACQDGSHHDINDNLDDDDDVHGGTTLTRQTRAAFAGTAASPRHHRTGHGAAASVVTCGECRFEGAAEGAWACDAPAVVEWGAENKHVQGACRLPTFVALSQQRTLAPAPSPAPTLVHMPTPFPTSTLAATAPAWAPAQPQPSPWAAPSPTGPRDLPAALRPPPLHLAPLTASSSATVYITASRTTSPRALPAHPHPHTTAYHAPDATGPPPGLLPMGSLAAAVGALGLAAPLELYVETPRSRIRTPRGMRRLLFDEEEDEVVGDKEVDKEEQDGGRDGGWDGESVNTATDVTVGMGADDMAFLDSKQFCVGFPIEHTFTLTGSGTGGGSGSGSGSGNGSGSGSGVGPWGSHWGASRAYLLPLPSAYPGAAGGPAPTQYALFPVAPESPVDAPSHAVWGGGGGGGGGGAGGLFRRTPRRRPASGQAHAHMA